MSAASTLGGGAEGGVTLKGDISRAADLATDDRSPIADPSSRLAAVLIDGLLPFVPPLVALPIGAALGSGTIIQAGAMLGWALMALLFVVDLVLLHRFGQTVGKRVVGLRIVRPNGDRASLARLFWLRSVIPGAVAWVPLVGWGFALADALCVFTADRRTLHDRMADTIVVDLRAPTKSTPIDEAFR